ncbi:MAG TPA: LysM peptidoglycan-binding domain-containing protein [Intrasporangium sp.]|nr:LysM peptidoglycan-binding domain-containing protein [Intrasporangium sp.]
MMTETKAPPAAEGDHLLAFCRAALLAAGGVTLTLTVLLPLTTSGWPLVAAVPDVDDVVSGLLAWASLVVACWVTAGVALTALANLPGAAGRGAARLAEALTPALVRRALALLLGTGIGTVGLPIAPVMASSAVSHSPKAPRTPLPATGDAGRPGAVAPSPAFAPSTGASDATAPAPDPRWLPSPPVRATEPQATALLAPTPRTAAVPDDTVTVRRGDSLWSIAARHLGSGASDHEVAHAWPRWYAANADLIGQDPDLIHPGQRLRIPDSGDHR